MIEELPEFKDIKKDKFKGKFKISSEEIQFGKITVKIVPVDESEESYKLYQSYCLSIHESSEKSMSSYINFLCKKGLNYIEESTSAKCQQKYSPSWDPENKHQPPMEVEGKRVKKMGCYHMKYYFE